MRPFNKLIILAILAASCAAVFGEPTRLPIQIGSLSYEIPIPAGFASVGPEDPAFAAVENVAAGNKLCALFMEAERASSSPSGSIAGRTCNVQISRQLIHRPCNKTSLEQALKETAEEQVRIQREAAVVMKNSGVAVDQIEAHPIHDRSERHFSYVIILHQNDRKLAVVTSVVLLKARLLYCYVNCPVNGDTDISGAQTTAKDWVSRLIALNPSDAATTAVENQQPGLDGITIGLFAALIAAGGIALWLIHRRKVKNGQSRKDHGIGPVEMQ